MNFKHKLKLLILVSIGVVVFVETALCVEFEVDRVVAAIKNEIEIARSEETGTPKLKIDSVDVVLSTIATNESAGGIKLNVAGVGAGLTTGVSKSNTQSIKLTLEPVGDIDIADDESMGLAPAIRSVKKAIKSAYNTEPRLKLKSFTFEVDFAVKEEAEGGISFYIVDIGGIKKSNFATHKVTFKMSVVTY